MENPELDQLASLQGRRRTMDRGHSRGRGPGHAGSYGSRCGRLGKRRFHEEEARKKAKTAKQEYENALRKVLYNF